MMKVFQNIHSLDDLIRKIQEYQNYILMVIGITTLIVAASFGFFYYKRVKEEGAYRAFTAAVEYFDAPIIKKDEKKTDDLDFLDKKEFSSLQEKWEKVTNVFHEAYEQHRSAGIAPLFLAYEAEALVQLGKTEEAIKVLEQIITMLDNEQAKTFYMIKHALLLIDTNDKATVEKGIEVLKTIARDEQSVAHDTALYQLGTYYWYTKDFTEAKNYWNQLILKYGKQEKHPSPWVEVAKEKLRLIDRDVE